MSSLVEFIDDKEESQPKIFCTARSYTNYNNNKYARHVLKPKNILKPKCSKILKRKLRKYKLRKDGTEDEDVVDVSKCLLSSLKIRSPNFTKNSDRFETEFIRPKNYLINNMARRKVKIVPENSQELTVSPKNKNVSPDTLPTTETSAELANTSTNVAPVCDIQAKKQTNAFKFMMDSRNKSIGGNSPGKTKEVDPADMEENREKKRLKVKRNLALQKMAEGKGSIERKEKEKCEEEFIKKKMKERSDRLKDMINKTNKIEKVKKNPCKSDTEKYQTDIVTHKKHDCDDNNENTNALVEITSQKKTIKHTKIVKLVDMFVNEIESSPKKSTRSTIAIEDEDFLKKLSPSIKKKENMLSYFNKIEKKTEISLEEDVSDENCSNIIKVKLMPKRKTKAKRKKLSLLKNSTSEILKELNDTTTSNNEISNMDQSSQDMCASGSNETRKRKRKDKIEHVCNENSTVEINNVLELKEGRPKRHVKKPMKYSDEINLTSSDEELHIFTPKRKKQIKAKSLKESEDIIISDEDSDKMNIKHKKLPNEAKYKQQKTSEATNKQQKSIKLAPIFSTKPQLTPEELEAKQKFLQSGIPEQLKKIKSQQKQDNEQTINYFPIVVHVQQRTEKYTLQESITVAYDTFEDIEYINVDNSDVVVKGLLSLSTLKNVKQAKLSKNASCLETLQAIKQSYPRFPVYRTYSSLKNKSKGEYRDYTCLNFDNSIEIINKFDNESEVAIANPDCLSWTDKYKATTTKELIGNNGTLKELKKWLTIWIENDARIKKTVKSNSDSSDFYNSEEDSRDSLKTANSLVVLAGPTGSGKTSAVYAVASELSIKVIEVNASTKRTGKLMLQDLQEATQSHKVNRRNAGSDNSQKSQEVPACEADVRVVKRGGKSKNKNDKHKPKVINPEMTENLSQSAPSQESMRTLMSLILIDDADIVFEQDDGFSSAISQLIHISKRPVILITSSMNCPHLQKFIQMGKVLHMEPLLPRLLGTWLDILCLADSGVCHPGLSAKFLDYFKGDIRKTINYLQFYIASQKDNTYLEEELASQTTSDNFKFNIEDESSSMSWVDNEATSDRNLFRNTCDPEQYTHKIFISSHLLYQYPSALLNTWWSVPNLFGLIKKNVNDSQNKTLKKKVKSSKALDAVVSLLDTLSVAEYMSKKDNTRNIFSQSWKLFESNSVSEFESLDTYSKKYDEGNEIIHELITCSITAAENCLEIDQKTDISCPRMSVQKAKDRIMTRHGKLDGLMTLSTGLDRRALALDYWPACRDICRTEKARTDTITKRNNRFYHYLKSMNVSSRTLDKLGDSLSCKKE